MITIILLVIKHLPDMLMKFLQTLLGLSLLSSGIDSRTVYNYSQIYFDSYNTVAPAQPIWDSSITFPLFNSSLGNLALVAVTLTATSTSSFSAYNPSSQQAIGSFCDSVGITGTLNGTTLASAYFNSPDNSCSQASYSLAQGQTWISPLYSRSFVNSMTFTDPTIVSQFSGQGNLTIPLVSESGLWNYVQKGNVQGTNSSVTIGCTGNIAYYYLT